MKACRPYFVVLALLLLALALIPSHMHVRYSGQAGVQQELPRQVGGWTGDDILYCQNAECQQVYLGKDLDGSRSCKECGHELGPVSLVEKQLLPADTHLRKLHYTGPADSMIFVSLVLSGQYRSSIHRPEVCLTGQGSEITHRFTHPIQLADGRVLKVTILEMLNRGRAPDGTIYARPTYYAYWFVGLNHETPAHSMRMIWMGLDNILHNVTHRWAYIAVSGSRGSSRDYLKELDAFIRDLHPQVVN